MIELITFFGIAFIFFSIPMALLRFGKHWLIALVPIYLITGNVFAESFFPIFGTFQDLATPIYSATFLITDMLSEHFSKEDAKKAVFAGFLGLVIFAGATLIIVNAPILPDKIKIYKNVFSVLPRLVVGSFVAYIVSQTWDVFIYHRLKKITGKKRLYLRNNISTITSQLLDTTIFVLIAFAGREPFSTKQQIIVFILTTWAFKVAVALLDYPFILWSVKKIKLNKTIN